MPKASHFLQAPSFQLLCALCLLSLLAACAPLLPPAPAPATPTATPYVSPVPTSELVPVKQIPVLPTHAPTSTPESEPVETSIQPTPESGTSVPQPTGQSELDSLLGADTDFGQADILIKRPGQLSRLTSPFTAIAYVDPGQERLVQVTLLGEDGRTLAAKKVKALPWTGIDDGNMITEINFQIEGLVELGRLEVSISDAFGRVEALSSVDVILLSMGETDRNYAPEIQDRIVIQYPLANYMVQGNSLLVSGLVRTDSEQPLTLQLIDESGNLIGQSSASVVLADSRDHGLFIGEIPYQVDAPVWVRLIVAIPGKRIPGFEFIKTMEMVISP